MLAIQICQRATVQCFLQVKVLDLIRKGKKLCAEVAKIRRKNESSPHGIVKKEKEACARFAGIPQTAKGTATVKGRCLDKMEKALNLYNKILIF